LALIVAAVAGACSDDKPAAAPATAPPTTLATTTTAPPTTSTTVRTSTTTSTTRTTLAVSIGPGEAFIGGSVIGPQGPVDGATVKIERLVGSAVASEEVTTSGGGAWRKDSVLGGAYRIRAFRAPDLSQSTVETFFLAAGERKTVDLRLTRTDGERITAVINPSPPRVNQSAVLTIQVGVGQVDAQGRPAVIPRAGVLLQLSPGPGQVLESSAQALTDGTGSASWRLRCVAEGPNPVSLTVGTGVTQVNLPPCAAAGAAAPAATSTTQAR
jgi:hypothetical protein